MAAADMDEDSAVMTCSECSEARADLLLLPCRHVCCQRCVEMMSQVAGETYGLSCPSAGCDWKFAIARPTDVHCRPTAGVQSPFVRDTYASEIKRKRIIGKSSDVGKIMGMTLVGNSLYLVSNGGSVKEYDVENVDAMEARSLPIAELKWPRGLAASRRLKVLYITDWQNIFGGALLRFPTRHAAVQSSVTKVVLNVQPFGVSVSECDEEDVRIFVTCATPLTGTEQQIVEYRDSGTDLQRMRVLKLPDSFQIPRHSVLTSGGEFVVCHGWTSMNDHRVSKMLRTDNKLTVVAIYGTTGGSGEQQLNRPLSLCVDEDGLILVVDYYNHRIQLLTHHLQLVRHLVTERDGIEYPRHVCLDKSRGLLFIGLQSGEIHVFRVRTAARTQAQDL